jgi:hypothetical protein
VDRLRFRFLAGVKKSGSNDSNIVKESAEMQKVLGRNYNRPAGLLGLVSSVAADDDDGFHRTRIERLSGSAANFFKPAKTSASSQISVP